MIGNIVDGLIISVNKKKTTEFQLFLCVPHSAWNHWLRAYSNVRMHIFYADSILTIQKQKIKTFLKKIPKEAQRWHSVGVSLLHVGHDSLNSVSGRRTDPWQTIHKGLSSFQPNLQGQGPLVMTQCTLTPWMLSSPMMAPTLKMSVDLDIALFCAWRWLSATHTLALLLRLQLQWLGAWEESKAPWRKSSPILLLVLTQSKACNVLGQERQHQNMPCDFMLRCGNKEGWEKQIFHQCWEQGNWQKESNNLRLLCWGVNGEGKKFTLSCNTIELCCTWRLGNCFLIHFFS